MKHLPVASFCLLLVLLMLLVCISCATDLPQSDINPATGFNTANESSNLARSNSSASATVMLTPENPPSVTSLPYPIIQTTILHSSEDEVGFGSSVSLYNDTAVIGSQSTVDVFKNTGGTWNPVAILSPWDTTSVSVYGINDLVFNDTIVVQGFPSTGGNQVYVFKNTGGTWNQVAILSPSETAECGPGGSVSLYNDTVVIGSDQNWLTPGGPSCLGDVSQAGNVKVGKVFVFKDTGGRWSQVAILSPSNQEGVAQFGSSVALYNDTVVIGAENIGSSVPTGQVYVFKNTGGDTWNQVAILHASDTQTNGMWANPVSLYNDTVVIGANFADSDSVKNAGQAYIFKNTGGDTWNQVAILNASDKADGAGFGSSVSLYNDMVVIGDDLPIVQSYNAGNGFIAITNGPGKAYVFKNTGGDTWNQVAILNASDSAPNNMFGSSVSLYNNTIVVGASQANMSWNNSGQVYTFSITAPRTTIPDTGSYQGENTSLVSVQDSQQTGDKSLIDTFLIWLKSLRFWCVYGC